MRRSLEKFVLNISLNVLTLAVVDVDDSVPIAQSLDETADDALGALGHGVDTNQVERTFGSRHVGEMGMIIRECDSRGGFVSFFIPYVEIDRARLFPTLWDTTPPAYIAPGQTYSAIALDSPVSFEVSVTSFLLPLFTVRLNQTCQKLHLPSRVRTIQKIPDSRLTEYRPGALCPQVKPRQSSDRRARRPQLGCWVGSLPGQGGCSAPVLRHVRPEPWPSDRRNRDHRAHLVPFSAKRGWNYSLYWLEREISKSWCENSREMKLLMRITVCLPRQGNGSPDPRSPDIVHEAGQLSG